MYTNPTLSLFADILLLDILLQVWGPAVGPSKVSNLRMYGGTKRMNIPQFSA